MLNEIDKTNLFNINNLKYISISNLFFDHPLNEQEIIDLKELLFKVNSINQIYFKGTIDIRSIEIIKYLLEIVPNINDSYIEKIILNTDVVDKNILLDMNYQNPNSWQIAYKKDKSSYMIASISRCKNMENKINEIINNINSKNYSLIEKIMYCYNYSKELNYNNKRNNLIDIVEEKKGDSYCFNLLFKELLDRLNIKSFMGEVKTDKKVENITAILVNDDKYNIDGIYIFDPCSDSIQMEECSNKNLRSINYNYFGVRLQDYNNNVFNDKLIGILSCLLHDEQYDFERLNSLIIDKDTRNKFNSTFGNDFLSVHKKVKSTKEINDEKLFSIIDNIIDKNYWYNKDIDIDKIIKTNYEIRENNIFKNTTQKIVLKN